MNFIARFWFVSLLAFVGVPGTFAGASAKFDLNGRLSGVEFSSLQYQWAEDENKNPQIVLQYWMGLNSTGELWRRLELSFHKAQYDEDEGAWRYAVKLRWSPQEDSLVESGLFQILPSDLDLGVFADLSHQEFVAWGNEDLAAGVQQTSRLITFSYSSDVYLDVKFHPKLGRATLSLKLK